MIKQFRSLHPLNIILLIILAFLLRWPVAYPAAADVSASFSELLLHLQIKNPSQFVLNSAMARLLVIVCTLLQAFYFNRVVNTHNLLGKQSYLPALLYIVSTSFFDPQAVFNPVLLVNFILILMLNQFLSIYRQQDAQALAFDMGMWIAIGAILYTPFIFFFFLIWIGLMIFRPFNWREWFNPLMGLFTPFFFLLFYYYWSDSLAQFQSIWLPRFSENLFHLTRPVELGIWILVGILGFVHLRANLFRSVVHIRKSYQILVAFYLIALLSAYLGLGTLSNHFLLIVLPASVLLAYYFAYATKRWLYELLFICLIVSVFYTHFFKI